MAETTKKPRKKKRRMRLPNGLGSVHKLTDKNRRKPWRARVPSHVVCNPETGRATQKYINIGYFETEEDAIAALMEYRKDPYTIEASTATFADVFEMWKAKKYTDVSAATRMAYNSAYKNCEAIHSMRMRDIRATHLEGVMMTVDGGYQLQSRLKTFWGLVFKYAMEHDIIQKNYSEFVKTREKDQGTKRTAIPPEDRAKIWQAIAAGDRDAEVAMIYIYTGMRPAELLAVKKENVDLEHRIMVGGLKTEAGKDRRIPLHRCIVPFIERLMQTPGESLFTWTDARGHMKEMSYNRFREAHWLPLMERLGLNYTGHYTRHTCATMLREAKVEEDIRKLILGHKNVDITNRYTHHSDAMLLEAIDSLPGAEGVY